MDKGKIEIITLENYKLGPKQIENTYEFLENTRLDTWNKITQIRKTTQDVENKRNMENSTKHSERMEMLRKIEESYDNDFGEVEKKALQLMNIEEADELQNQYEELRQMCHNIIKKKTGLIVEYSKQLDYKDQLYVDSLKKFRNDIQMMLKFMREQFLTLRDQMLINIELIENKYKEDRKKLIQDYKDGIEKLVNKLNECEEEKERMLTNLEDELEHKAEKDAAKLEMEYINKIILMEKHANFLKESIEDFTYEVKILVERLDYRVEVREEKIKENKIKRNRFKDLAKELRNKRADCLKIYTEKDLENRIKNLQLKEELMKMTDAYDKLKEKFQHFEKYDDLRFKDIFNMKSKETRELALKVALADRTIKAQQLGMEILNNNNSDGFTLEDLQRKETLFEDGLTDEKEQIFEDDINFRQNILTRIPSERVKQVFMFIIEEAEFLIESTTIEQCLGMTLEEKLPYYVESICKALSINNEQELNQLMALFDKNNLVAEKDDMNFILDQSIDDSRGDIDRFDPDRGSKLEIDPDNVLRLLREFYEEKKKKTREQMKVSATGNAFNKDDENNIEVKNERIRFYSESYWNKLGKIISDKTFNVWKALEKGLTNYHDMLFERKQLVEEVKEAQEKNRELKKLLHQYMESDDNKALKIPPYQTMKKSDLNLAVEEL